MLRKIFAFCMTLLLLLVCALPASAEGFDLNRKGSLSVTLLEHTEKTPLHGAELKLYRVATVSINSDGRLTYVFTEEFADWGFAIDDPDLAKKLEDKLSRMNMPAIKKSTDEKGVAVFEDLPLGLYLVRQISEVPGFAVCDPFLVSVPAENSGEYLYEVTAAPKAEIAKLTSILIRKVWNTDAANPATDSVTVQLLRDGKVVDTAVLNEENNWHFIYYDMPESDAYSIKELNVPKGFTATYKQDGYDFTVTNTPTLAQTGQLIWPLPVLAISGMFLICIGILLLWKKEKRDA